MPSPSAPPPGCAFHPRCPLYAKKDRPELCRTTPPPLEAKDGSDGDAAHRAACHFAGELTPAS